MTKEEKTSLAIYQSENGKVQVAATLENETLWLTQKDMAAIFDVNVPAISKHVDNIFREGELQEKPTISKMEIVQNEGSRQVKRQIECYNLDMIIAVGYRVNSSKATKFRIWATSVLKDYLVKGFALNQRRLEETKLHELEQMVSLIKKNIGHTGLSHKETEGLLKVITHYTYSWILLQKYDEGSLTLPDFHHELQAELTYKEAKDAIQQMKKKFLPQKHVSELFGIERNDEFKGILQSIYQTFDKHPLYPIIEEKAAHLLYFTVKNHPFADGNKKIGAFLFLRFLAKNKCLYHPDGSKKIDDATVVAITLLVATCDKNQKDMIIRLIVNFLAKKE